MGKSIILAFVFGFLIVLSPSKSVNANIVLKVDSLKVGDEAPRFVMRNLMTGEDVYLRDYTGKTLREPWKKKERHVVVLSFWATWCQPCKNEIPILSKLALEFKNLPIKFFLVNTMEKSEQIEDSVHDTYKNRGYVLPCLVDPSCRNAGQYSVRSLPALVVIDKFGTIRKFDRGYHENFQVELEKLLNELVKESDTTKK